MLAPITMDSVWLAGAAAVLLVAGAALLRGFRPPRRPARTLSLGGSSASAALPLATMPVGSLDLGAEIERVLTRLEPLAKDRGVTFTLAIAPQLVGRAEPDAFRQAVSDLLVHAVGRTPNGSVLVSAGQQGGRVRVAVSDDGPFGDEPGARTALRMVSEFLASQGGSLEIDNLPGEGMTVTMRLPAAQTIDAATMPFADPGRSAASPA